MKKQNSISLWHSKYKKSCMRWTLAFLLAAAVWSVVALGAAYGAHIQGGISEKVLRFHVLANSDTASDQALKLAVRDRILEEYGARLSACQTKAESMAYLQNSRAEIAKIAEAEVAQQGYDYDVTVSVVREDFPEKQYGDLVFPAGVYDALRVEIGAAKGHNWWCVLYPQMCYVDATWSEPTEESHIRLQNTLTEEEYVVVSALEQEQKMPKIKLKLVELFQ